VRFFKITFPGVYLAGAAIVAADSEQEALAMVKIDTVAELDEVTIAEIPVFGPSVLYVDDGDY